MTYVLRESFQVPAGKGRILNADRITLYRDQKCGYNKVYLR
eukprot:UN05815